jgi:beta-galactosidase
VQYEQAHGNERYTDVFCPMYINYNQSEAYCRKPDIKIPLIQCEYAHAMGNSQGGFKEYWNLTRKYQHYQGGFIWDFVDQSIRIMLPNGTSYYGYGDDWNPYDASHNNFCTNGLVSPDRVPNPHMYEVGHIYQSIWVTPVDLVKGEVSVFNEYFFRDLSDFYAEWQLLAAGEVIQSGIVELLNVKPQEKKTLQLGYTIENACLEKELLLNECMFQTKKEGTTASCRIYGGKESASCSYI